MREAEGDVHLHVDGKGVDAEQRGAAEAGKHGRALVQAHAPADNPSNQAENGRKTGQWLRRVRINAGSALRDLCHY
jgi:hypothetical protein